MNPVKVLFIGDIFGRPGRNYLRKILSTLHLPSGYDLVIANAENAAGGNGLTPAVAGEIFNSGVDVLTLGNHSWDRREIEGIIEQDNILRPANYPPGVKGKGYTLLPARCHPGLLLGVVNLMGRVYLPNIDCPFRKSREIIDSIRDKTKIVIVDFHAEVTSEKQAMGWFLDGLVSAVIGTHTHVQTADARILPQGTGYLTDCGMVGPLDSVIGIEIEPALRRFLTGITPRYEVAPGKMLVFSACHLEIDPDNGHSQQISRIYQTEEISPTSQ